MPLRKPHKDESQTDWMKYCMHEVSQNPDRSNEQNVAICLQAWRDRDKKEEEPRQELAKVLERVGAVLMKMEGE